ncbi:MAG: glycosyltransferase family 4 protein [Pseudomonadota bacterium]
MAGQNDEEACSTKGIDALQRENRELRTELDRVNNSLRMRAASIFAENLSSPLTTLTIPAKLIRLLRDVRVVKQWRKVVLGLECGLPDDPLRLLTPERQELAELKSVASSILNGRAPPAVTSAQPSRAVQAALVRSDELEEIVRSGADWELPKAEVVNPVSPKRVVMPLHACEQDIVNGYTRRSHELIQALQQTGWDISGAVRGERSTDVASTARQYERVGTVPSDQQTHQDYVSRYAERLYQHFIKTRPAIVHAASNHVTGLAASIAAKRANLPLIYEIRGLWEETRRSVEPSYLNSLGYCAQQQLEIETAKRADHLLVNGRPLAELFSQRGIAEDKITVVPNGCASELNLEKERQKALQNHLSLSGEPVIGFVGSLTSYEGLELVFEALSGLRTLPFQLLIVGDGPARMPLQDKARALRLSDKIHWMGRVSPSEATAAYGLIDIAPFVRSDTPVTRLTPPLKPLDAMLSNTAMLLSDLPPLAEFAEDGRALLVPPGDVSTIRKALKLLITDADAREAMAEKAKQWVLKNRQWTTIAKTIDGAYKTVLAQR